jgi:NTP pyrophosphohydrolases including oxidative damage repair enzymes
MTILNQSGNNKQEDDHSTCAVDEPGDTFLGDDWAVVTSKRGKSAVTTRRTSSSGGSRGTTTFNNHNSRIPRQNCRTLQQRKCNISIFREKVEFSKFVVETQAVRFKVHRPGCQYSKIVKIMDYLIQERDRDLRDLHVPIEEGFIILPECKAVRSIFVGGQANSQSYPEDPLPCERTLHNVLFPLPQSIHGTPIKVSCAQCMLQIEPNGFVCITSSSRELVDNVRNMAIDSKKRCMVESKGTKLLHSDHADYLCVLRFNTVENNVFRSFRQNLSKNSKDLHRELLQQNVPIHGNTSVNIGHHLSRAIDLFKERRRDIEHENVYILTTVVQTIQSGGRVVLDLDIPGGKRHLGESSLECALRETLEETSLVIETSWIVDVKNPMRNTNSVDDSCNVFYQVLPPSSSSSCSSSNSSTTNGKTDGLDDILSDMFWINTGLDM